MGIFRRRRPHRTRAQSIVEFALVLPILLLLIYGLLEAGRLIFIYSIVTTASREAARYGSATGLTVVAGPPQYQNCAGIRGAAQSVDFIGVIDDVNITIQYDTGPQATAKATMASLIPGYPNIFATCPNGGTYTGPLPESGDRIVVRVTAQYTTLVGIVPLGPITVRSANARTILVSLSVAGTALPPPTLPPPTPTSTATATLDFTPTATSPYSPTSTLSPTNTLTPSETPTPSDTPTPSETFTPSNTPTNTATHTATATPVSCSLLRHSTITTPGSTMVMQINNPTGAPLTVTQIYVSWNYAGGHQTGGDKTLRLNSITLGGVSVVSGLDLAGPTQAFGFPSAAGITLPNGVSSIVFTFHQSYDNESGELIQLQFANNGCQNYTLSSSTPSVWP